MDEQDDKILAFQSLGKGKTGPPPRSPVEDPEGVDTTAFPRSISQGKDARGQGTPGAVTLSQIGILDLISEGEIEGLVTGSEIYSGTAGNLGFDKVDFTLYPEVSGVRFLRSIYWNEVPVVNSENQFNYQQINLYTTRGLPNGASVPQIIDETTSVRPIGERLRFGPDFAKIYRILNPYAKAIEVNIRFSQLSITNLNPDEMGDVEEATVIYEISRRPLFSTPGKTPGFFSNIVQETVRGKISNGYIRKTRLELFSSANNYSNNTDFLGWEIKIQRLTEDTINASLRNQTAIDSVIEIFGDVFLYPNAALVASKFSAETFSQIPARAYDVKLLKVKVPSNYFPSGKTYTSPDDWDGTFAEHKKWTDNPAWCYYDLITNSRYGLGNYIDESQIDKWTLYEIGKYCDTMVPDPYTANEGGVEPRFSCNLIINSREEAYKVIDDMASIFRAMSYYSAGSIFVSQDSPRNPIYQFTNSNVEDGNFNYSSSSKRVRHTTAVIRYNDKNNFYKPSVEYIEDVDGIKRYGIRETELTAFGVVSRGQAVRLGKWALLSENLLTETVTFTAGLDANILRPGDVVQIFDKHRHKERYGGRTSIIYHSSGILLDAHVPNLVNDSIYNFHLLTPTFSYNPSGVNDLTSADFDNIRRNQIQFMYFSGAAASGITGADKIVRTQISFSGGFDVTNYHYSGNLVWMIEGSGANNPLYNQFKDFKIIKLEERDSLKINVTALEYNSGIFDLIESGAGIEQPDYATSIPATPKNLSLSVSKPSPNSAIINYKFGYDNLIDVQNFLVYVKKDDFEESDVNNGNLAAILPPSITNGTFAPLVGGEYFFRVYARNRYGRFSASFASNNAFVGLIDPIKDVSISSLRLSTGNLSNSAGTTFAELFESDSPQFSWQVGFNNATTIPTGISYRVTARLPSNSNIPSPSIFFETGNLLSGQINNLLYTFDFANNYHAFSPDNKRGPFREFDFIVEAMQDNGQSSAGGNFKTSLKKDSNYDNNNGYDIVYVKNPRITDFNLTSPDGIKPTDKFHTDQWLTPDGDIKLKIIAGGLPADLAGAFVYFSTESFNQDEAYGLIPTTKTITRENVTQSGSPIVIGANLVSANNAYVGVSVYDSFDLRAIQSGINIFKDLSLTNIVKASKRGTTLKSNSEEIILKTLITEHIFPHGLGNIPTYAGATLICKIPQWGYTVGEEIDVHSLLTPIGNLYSPAFLIIKNNIDIRTIYFPDIRIKRKADGAIVYLTNSNWRLKIYSMLAP